MSLFSFLKPPPHKPEIQNPTCVASLFKYWRMRTFLGMYVGYIAFYLSRRSLPFAIPSLIDDLGYSKSDLGLLVTIMAVMYGFSKFVSGILSDRSNPRFFMGIGLMLTGMFNLCFGFSSILTLFALSCGLNGWFQGWGWPPCARLLTHWYSQDERGKWWGVWNSSHGIGAGLMALSGPIIATYFGWRCVFWIPGALCVLLGFFVIYTLRDVPRAMGLPTIEKFRGVESAETASTEKNLSFKEILFKYVLKNKYIWILAISYFFVYVIREGMFNWGTLLLKDIKGYSAIAGGLSVLLFEGGGICGNIFSGWATDYFFKGRRAPICVLFCAGAVIALAGLWSVPSGLPILASLLMFMIGFFIFGPQMLVGMIATEVSHKEAAGTATGFLGWIAYLGAACSGYPLARIAEIWGWKGCFFALSAGGVIAGLLLLPLWSISKRPTVAQEPQESLAEEVESEV